MPDQDNKTLWGLSQGAEDIIKSSVSEPNVERRLEAMNNLFAEAWNLMTPSARLKLLQTRIEPLLAIGTSPTEMAREFAGQFNEGLEILKNQGLDCFQNDDGFFIAEADIGEHGDSGTFTTMQDAVFNYLENHETDGVRPSNRPRG